jgi:hypothetical protein
MHAFEARRKQQGLDYSVGDDRSSFGRVFRDIGRESSSWPEEVVDLIDRKNWNVKRLRMPNGKTRRPKAYLSVDVTSKGNLALDWFPHRRGAYPFDYGDWMRWDNEWPIGGSSYPFNRIVFIHDFDSCFGKYSSDAFSEAEEYLAQAIRDLLDNIFRFLRRFVEVEVLNDLFLEYSEAESFLDREFLSVTIRDAAEYQREREEQKRQEWLAETFDERLGIKAEDLLRAFDAAGRKYAPTARRLSPSLRRGATLSSEKIKRLLKRLRSEFPELYNSVLGDANRAEQPGDIVELNRYRRK